MSKISKNKIYEKITSILKIKISNIHIFWCISSIYALVWLILACNPHEFRRLAQYNVLEYLIELIILTFEYIFWVYLPEIVIFIFDFIVKKYELNNKNIIKSIRILFMILSYIYLIVFGILIYVVIMGARGLFIDP